MRRPTRPVMRYFGGKWKLAPWIIGHFPPHRLYIEPFGGAASLLIQKQRAYAEVYNDVDGEIVNVFRVLRDPGTAAELERRIRLTPFARDELDFCHRGGHGPVGADRDPPADRIERARRMIVKAYMGFGPESATKQSGAAQGFRSDNNRAYTTPAHDWANWPRQIRAFTERLRAVVIENRDWRVIIDRYDRQGALFYCDPPYLHSTRSAYKHARGGRQYYYEMTEQEHIELADVLHRIRGMAIISGYPSALYDRLYADWGGASTKNWSVSGNKGAGEFRLECIWISPRARINHHTINLFN